jgi:hypothetical protein
MVKLDPAGFVVATAQMCKSMGLRKTKLMVRLRPGTGRIYLRASDQRNVLTTVLKDQAELKLLDFLISKYVEACTRRAPAEGENSSASAKKKAKKGR